MIRFAMTVVLGGSRNLNHVPAEVQLRLDAWIEADVNFVVGDASGVDTVFQRWLMEHGYTRVRVFSSAPEVRNNLGPWPVEHVDSGLKSRGSAMHAAKDREMTRIADEGLMLWDGESTGTLANVLDLAAQEKDAYLYLAPQAELFRFESGLGLLEWAREYPEALAQAQTRLKQFAKRQAKALGATDPSPTLFDEAE